MNDWPVLFQNSLLDCFPAKILKKGIDFGVFKLLVLALKPVRQSEIIVLVQFIPFELQKDSLLHLFDENIIIIKDSYIGFRFILSTLIKSFQKVQFEENKIGK